MKNEPLDHVLEISSGAFRATAEPLTRIALVQLALVLGLTGAAACELLSTALGLL